jgi:hypothetical protein
MSEAEKALRQELKPEDAERLLDVSGRELVAMWRDEQGRDGPLWKSFFKLPQEAQEGIAAGFQYLGRKPE